MRTDAEVVALMAQRGAALGDCGRMCSECAFKLGSAANVEDENASAALVAATTEGVEFHCHPQGGYGDGKKVCVGFLYARQYLNSFNSK